MTDAKGTTGKDGATTTGKDGTTTGTRDGSTTKIPDGSSVGTDIGFLPTNQPQCNGTVYACSDGKDNDGDGKPDALDPECVGPCDDDEASFATGIPGDNIDACKQDCFFDGNSGQGDDGCNWDLRCDPKNPGGNLAKKCPYDPEFKACPGPQSNFCIQYCRALAPNGCDCFGCCDVYVKGVPHTVYLGSGPTCSVTTPENCATCTKSTDCINDCGECELCLGRTISDLPASCFGGGSSDGGTSTTKDGGGTSTNDSGRGTITDGGTKLPSCPTGQTSCLINDNCSAGQACITGCCVLLFR